MARRAQFFFKLKARAFRHLATPQNRRENFQIARHLIVGRLTGNGKLNFFRSWWSSWSRQTTKSTLTTALNRPIFFQTFSTTEKYFLLWLYSADTFPLSKFSVGGRTFLFYLKKKKKRITDVRPWLCCRPSPESHTQVMISGVLGVSLLTQESRFISPSR